MTEGRAGAQSSEFACLLAWNNYYYYSNGFFFRPGLAWRGDGFGAAGLPGVGGGVLLQLLVVFQIFVFISDPLVLLHDVADFLKYLLALRQENRVLGEVLFHLLPDRAFLREELLISLLVELPRVRPAREGSQQLRQRCDVRTPRQRVRTLHYRAQLLFKQPWRSTALLILRVKVLPRQQPMLHFFFSLALTQPWRGVHSQQTSAPAPSHFLLPEHDPSSLLHIPLKFSIGREQRWWRRSWIAQTQPKMKSDSTQPLRQHIAQLSTGS